MVLSFDSDAAKWKYRDKPIATKRSHKPFEFQKKDAKWVDWNIRDVVTGLAQAVLLQRLLRPLHDWAMDVLRRLPCNGTFDQPKPLIRLTGRSIVYSCDLTAATDRWPYQLISQLVESWFGRGILQPQKMIARKVSFVEFTSPTPNLYISGRCRHDLTKGSRFGRKGIKRIHRVDWCLYTIERKIRLNSFQDLRALLTSGFSPPGCKGLLLPQLSPLGQMHPPLSLSPLLDWKKRLQSEVKGSRLLLIRT